MTIIKGLNNIGKNFGDSLDYIKLKDGGHVIVRFLIPSDEIVGAYEHTLNIGTGWRTVFCPGEATCPICSSGKKPSFRAHIPLLDRESKKVKVLKASKDMLKTLSSLIEEYGELTERDFKIVREGEKLQTTYRFYSKDASKEDLSQYTIPNIEDRLKPHSRETILNILSGDTQVPANDNIVDDKAIF